MLLGCASAPPTPAPASPTVMAPTPTATPTQSPSPTVEPTISPTQTPTQAPTPTDTPDPTPTEVPSTPTPAPDQGLVVSEDEIARHLDALAQIATQNGGLRAAGLPGYDASVEYVAAELGSLGYSVRTHSFEFPFFDEAAPVTLAVGESSWSGGGWLHAMLYSAPGDVSGVLETVSLDGPFSTGTGGCEASDWSGFSSGHVAVLASGPCFRRQQIENAQQAGASAVISIYPNWEAGQTRRPTLLFPDGITIPAMVAGREPALALLDAAETGESAQLVVETISEQRTIDNVIAELPGTTDQILFLGGHLDSVLDGPGLNDNGSGVATLLALAAAVSDRSAVSQPTQTLRFGFWGAEEFGDIGSGEYVQQLSADEIDRISAYLNLDMVGSPNAARFVYDDALAAPGSDELAAALLAALDELDAPGERLDIGASSDHFSFGQAGIPTGGVFSGLAPLSDAQALLFDGEAGLPADPCYHLACDGRANIKMSAAVMLGQAVANVVEDLAY